MKNGEIPVTNKPVLIRMNEEIRKKAKEQAAKLGLSLSEYVRLLISLDASRGITNNLKAD